MQCLGHVQGFVLGYSTHIGVGHGQGKQEGQTPDQQQRSPTVGGGAESPGPHGVHNHDVSKHFTFHNNVLIAQRKINKLNVKKY